MKNSTITRLASVATIVAAALSLAGVAFGGGLRPDDRAGLRPVAAAPAIPSDVVRPDDRAGLRGADHAVLATGTHALDEGGAWTATAAWSAAGLLVFVLGAAVVVRRNHRGAQSNA